MERAETEVQLALYATNRFKAIGNFLQLITLQTIGVYHGKNSSLFSPIVSPGYYRYGSDIQLV